MRRASQPEPNNEDRLGRGLQVSFLIHTLGLLLILTHSYLFRDSVKPYIPSLKVDIVALPDLLKSEIKKAHQRELQKELSQILAHAEKNAQKIQKEQNQIKSKKEPPPALPHEMAFTQSKSSRTQEPYTRNRQALDRLKLLAKIQKNLEDHPKKPSASELLIKGNQISHGSSHSEDAQESLDQSYYDLLKDRLQGHWSLPPWISRQKLSAQVEIRIDPHGHLSQIQFVKPSGNSQFDEAVRKTIQMSQPFPLPPEEVQMSVQKNGILIGFPL